MGTVPFPFPFAESTVQLWALRMQASDAQIAHAAQWLAADELARARSYTAEPARREFVLTRAALRRLLGRYVGEAPAALRFEVGPRGKPALRTHGAPAAVEFNVAHSGGIALLAFGIGCAIGVDIEACRPLPDLAALAERVFDGTDAARWQALPPDERLPAFYRAWARKEACAKATGDGLWAELKTVDRHHGLTLHELDVGPGHAAALAHPGAPRALSPLRWLDVAGLLKDDAAFATAA